jgi:hypothetical protein
MEFEYKRLGTRGLVAVVRPDTGEAVPAEFYHKQRRYDSQATIAFLEQLRAQLQAQGYRRIHARSTWGSTTGPPMCPGRRRPISRNMPMPSWPTSRPSTHASWLNLCENFFSTFTRRYLRHRRYISAEAFDEALAGWLLDHNRRAKPLRWTYAPHQKAA